MKKCSFCAVAALLVAASGDAEAAPVSVTISGFFDASARDLFSVELVENTPIASGIGAVLQMSFDDTQIFTVDDAPAVSARVSVRAPEIGVDFVSNASTVSLFNTSAQIGITPPLVSDLREINTSIVQDGVVSSSELLDATPRTVDGEFYMQIALFGQTDFVSPDPSNEILQLASFGDVLVEVSSGAAVAAPEIAPLLPDAATPEGGFSFAIAAEDIDPDATIWIDPDYAVGYVYEVENALVDAVTAPSFDSVPDTDGYLLSYETASGLVQTPLGVGATVLPTEPLSRLWITMIDEALMLDPADGLAFRTGLSFTDVVGDVRITQTPVIGPAAGPVAPIPVPAPLGMLVAGLAGLTMLRRAQPRRRSE